MRYVQWVKRVFEAVAAVAPASHGGVGLAAVAEALQLGSVTWDDFAQHRQPGEALVTAMHDLESLAFVEFPNVGHGNHLTPTGRDVAVEGLDAALDELREVSLSESERTFLARLYEASRVEEAEWSEPMPGFEKIEERLADLKSGLAAAVTDDDLSDIGRRCREMPADAVDVVFRTEMVPDGHVPPSPQDAEERLALYLAVRAGGQDHKELRKFLRASLELANARTHSARTGRAAAVASAQGLISFIRALQAIERSASGRTSPRAPSRAMATKLVRT